MARRMEQDRNRIEGRRRTSAVATRTCHQFLAVLRVPWQSVSRTAPSAEDREAHHYLNVNQRDGETAAIAESKHSPSRHAEA